MAAKDLGSFSEQMLRIVVRSIAATSIYSAQMLISHNVSFDDGSVCRLFNQSLYTVVALAAARGR